MTSKHNKVMPRQIPGVPTPPFTCPICGTHFHEATVILHFECHGLDRITRICLGRLAIIWLQENRGGHRSVPADVMQRLIVESVLRVG